MNDLQLLQKELRGNSTVDLSIESFVGETLGLVLNLLPRRHYSVKGEISNISFATEENHHKGMTRVPSCKIVKSCPRQYG